MQNGNMVKKLMAAQASLTNAQKEIAKEVFEGVAQGGLVKLQLNGKGDLLGLTIDPSVMSEDGETVAALVKTAYGSAQGKKEAFTKKKLDVAQGSILPLGLRLPGMGA
ncbi:YbaB/EbfC family nucleoid-associated protein [Paraburkholderia sp. UCT31]|uniref:YbaB/EbfC family nucleoid-associated protein n=1 Tax=Paraburkholderia sp. UCT31 TaxID=2615209 RepID=UPI0016560CB6|nr:YbaB/EbfC family nucleoid-associated protein [Paraburkholderia sp. UCT31]MBC8737271.1 YbaB/EbfC family nucleoid-associated protein [Paraburkholderia sp. UCT31]